MASPILMKVVLVCLVLCLAAGKDCSDLHGDLQVFREAMEQGDFSCATSFVKATTPEKIAALKTEYDMMQRKITKDLTELKSVLESSAPAKRLTPAFEWCQSTDSVFLNVKFSHKLDAPATLNVEASTVDIQGKKIILEANNGEAKFFSLELPLHAEIVPEESTYDYASVGRMTFVLKKLSAPSRWPKLVEKGFNVQQRLGKSVMHFWHQMHEKYAEELDLMDDEDDDEDDKKRKEKAREKLRKEKMKEDIMAQAHGKSDDGSSSSSSEGDSSSATATDSSESADAAAGSSFEEASAVAAQANEKAFRDEEAAKKAEKEEKVEQRKSFITKAKNAERDAITDELAELDAELKRRKKEVEGRAVEEKFAIEAEIKARKGDIDKAREARLARAEKDAQASFDQPASPSPLTSADGEKEEKEEL